MERKIDTNPKLAMKQPQGDFSAQTDLIATTSLPPVALLENSQLNLTLKLTTCSPPGTLSREKKKEILQIVIIVKNVVFSMGVKLAVITVCFGLILMQRIANTWSICTTLAYLAKMKTKKCLLKSQNTFVKDITPIHSSKILWPKCVLKKSSISHL